MRTLGKNVLSSLYSQPMRIKRSFSNNPSRNSYCAFDSVYCRLSIPIHRRYQTHFSPKLVLKHPFFNFIPCSLQCILSLTTNPSTQHTQTPFSLRSTFKPKGELEVLFCLISKGPPLHQNPIFLNKKSRPLLTKKRLKYPYSHNMS